MTASAASVLIIGRMPENEGLEEVLGAERAQALATELVAGAEAWAQELAPGRVQFASAEEWYGTVERELARCEGPLLLAQAAIPRLCLEHGEQALSDLDAGCDLVLGPMIDGGFYLVAVDRPRPELAGLLEPALLEADAMTLALSAAREAELEVGILRAERPLLRPADVDAALADPLLRSRLRAVIG